MNLLRGQRPSKSGAETLVLLFHIFFLLLAILSEFREAQKISKETRTRFYQYHKLVFCLKLKIMARNKSIIIGDYYENFINGQITTGRYSSVSEVVRTALRHFEKEEIQKQSLLSELEIGEKSRKIHDFDRKENLDILHNHFQK